MKKIITLIIVCVLALSFSAVAYADEVETEASELHELEFRMENGQLTVDGLEQDNEKAWTNFYDRFKNVIQGVVGAIVLACILYLAMGFWKIATSLGNVNKRQEGFSAVSNALIALAGLGGLTIIASFAYGAF